MVNVLVTYADGTILTWMLYKDLRMADLHGLISQRGKVRRFVISGATLNPPRYAL